MIAPIKECAETVLYAIPHRYSCGGYWVAEAIGDAGEVWLVSGREVLSPEKVERVRQNVQRNHGLPTRVEWLDELPAGSVIKNLRN